MTLNKYYKDVYFTGLEGFWHIGCLADKLVSCSKKYRFEFWNTGLYEGWLLIHILLKPVYAHHCNIYYDKIYIIESCG